MRVAAMLWHETRASWTSYLFLRYNECARCDALSSEGHHAALLAPIYTYYTTSGRKALLFPFKRTSMQERTHARMQAHLMGLRQLLLAASKGL
eukprot:1158017-Pelagomonas_calceolata.AAC.3